MTNTNNYPTTVGFTEWALGICEDFEMTISSNNFEREHGLYWLSQYMITAHTEFNVPGDVCMRIISIYLKRPKAALSELRHLANYGW